ncbi:MAG: biotin/lipoyl-containing protein [Oceanococcus sp.]
MKHGLLIYDQEHDLGLSRSADGYRLHHDGEVMDFKLNPRETGGWLLHSGHEIDSLHIAIDGDDVHIHLRGETYQLRFEHALQRLAQSNAGATSDMIKATMPGNLISLEVTAGDTVEKGQTLLVMESMKMETTIVAPRDGLIADVLVAPGQTFDKDAVLLSLQPESDV